MIKQTDIELVINDYKVKSNPNDRFTSFDYCYNYFRTTNDLTVDMEKSCLVLGFYLASWGMFRGSSFLLQHSVKHFTPTVLYINSLDKSVWDIDVDKYDDKNIELITLIYKEIQKRLILNGNAHLTLVTKVLLGVFGFIPAFDKLFCDTFRLIFDGKCGFRSVNKVSLTFVQNFYQQNKTSIDHLSNNTYTIDFLSGKETKINYPKAKIIDMYGFNKNNFMTSEKVFEISGEGGGICIKRQKTKTGEMFLYNHSEFDPTDEGLDINEKDEFKNFENPFQLINYKSSWYTQHITAVHEDFRVFIVEELIKKLNKEAISPDSIYDSNNKLEESFRIKLVFKTINGKTIWSYTERDE